MASGGQRNRTAAAAVLTLALGLAPAAAAQTLSPVDAREAARFDDVVRASAHAGYTAPFIVGHGSGAADALFVVQATRDGKAVLVGVTEPRAAAAIHAVELEHGDSPAQMAVHGVHVTVFLNTANLYDLVVTHEPVTVAAATRFDTHYVLRRQSGGLEVACEFPGDASSSGANGIGSTSATRRVTIERVPHAAMLTFAVHTVEALTALAAPRDGAAHTPVSETIRQLELPAAATCKER